MVKKNTFHFLLQLCIASVTTVVFATENDDRNYCKHGYPEVENPTIENVENPQIQAVDIPLLESYQGAEAVLFIDFDGHTETHSFWGTTLVASPKTYTNAARYEKIFNVVAEHFRPWKINVTTDSTVFNKAPLNRRQRAVVTASDVVAGSGQAQAWSFSDPNGASAFIEANGKSVFEVGNTISHEVGHAFGLKHDGDAANGNVYAYYSTINWAPIMGSTNAIGVTQWNNGDYSNANNPEDDMNIFISAPNNLQYRDDEQGATFQTASELNYGNGKFKNNEGIIEKMTDVDAWKFKTDGGDVSILIESNPGITVLEVDAEIFNVDTEESFSFSQIKNLSAEFIGNIPAGNYLLLVRSGIHFTTQNEGPTNYGSVGRYEISGTAPNVKKTDNITNDFSFKILSPTYQSVTLTTVLDTNWIPFTIQTIDADKNHQIELMIDGEWKKMTAKSTNEWEYLAPAYLTQKSDIYVKMINKGQIKDSIFSINIFQPNVYPISYKQLKVVGFSSEMPDDNPYKIAGGEAAWIADGDTTTTWANALETNGWAPFPHWIEIELDSVYDLSALRIVGAENIRTFIPDSMTLYLDKDGSGTWSDSISATLNFQGELDLIFPIKEKRLAKKIKLEVYRTFGETEICSIAEIIPFKRKNNPILALNQNEFVENKLYPLQNPTINGTNLTMVLETNEVSHADVRIVNTLGEVVYIDEFITTKNNEINWTPINKGLYIIQVIVEGKTLENLSTKVIVE